jgi:branched-chain amino acid transport system permease protein
MPQSIAPPPPRFPAATLLATVVIAALPLVLPQAYALTLATRIAVLVVFVLSYHLLYGQTGLLSFGHALYFGAGAYCAAHALNAWGGHGLPVTLLPLAGGAGGALAAAMLGWLNARRGGLAFAMISLGLAELALALTPMLPSVFGGEAGITINRVTSPGLFGVDYASPRQVYALAAAWMLAAGWAMHAFTRTPLGRLARAVRDNPARTAFLGCDPGALRWRVLVVAGFFAGIAGALSAIQYEVATAEALGRAQSAAPLVAEIIGGAASFGGPIAGAVLYELAASGLASLTPAWPFYLGCLFIGVVLYAPEGLAGAWREMRRTPRAVLGGCTAGGLAAACGLVLLVEFAYLRAGNSQPGVLALALGLDSAHSALPWLAGALLLAGGTALCTWAARAAPLRRSAA